MTTIAFYGSHNSAYAIEKDGKIICVAEVERLLNIKNAAVAQYNVAKPDDVEFFANYLPKILMQKFNLNEFDLCLYGSSHSVINSQVLKFEEVIPAKEHKCIYHHQAHANGCFYQSPFEQALIFSFDGGGEDGFFNVYYADRKNGIEILEHVLNPTTNTPHMFYDLGFPFMVFGHFLEDIRQEAILSEGNLVYPGKLMGLSSYGNVITEWLPYFMQFYKMGPNGPNYQYALDLLAANISRGGYPGGKVEIVFDVNNRISGQIAYDIAATSQKAFEECFLEIAKPYFKKYPDLPICMTGGCALNIILNTRIVEEFNKEVFVGPNPNDCGLAAGMLLTELKPDTPADLTYAGLPLLDLDMLSHHILSYPLKVKSSFLDKKVLAQDLFDGNIVGVARGNSEHGPRALGNRSILCNPTIANMKDILNEKVKNREWYRPFAPVVRLEDVSKYFEWNKESRWMSFCPRVRPEWRETLAAITHVDGTARVQTVTREQNEWLYDLLTEFEQLSGVGVLLNTSFNVNGKPILSSVSDAFTIFEKTRMDRLVIEDTYFTKY